MGSANAASDSNGNNNLQINTNFLAPSSSTRSRASSNASSALGVEGILGMAMQRDSTIFSDWQPDDAPVSRSASKTDLTTPVDPQQSWLESARRSRSPLSFHSENLNVPRTPPRISKRYSSDSRISDEPLPLAWARGRQIENLYRQRSPPRRPRSTSRNDDDGEAIELESLDSSQTRLRSRSPTKLDSPPDLHESRTSREDVQRGNRHRAAVNLQDASNFNLEAPHNIGSWQLNDSMIFDRASSRRATAEFDSSSDRDAAPQVIRGSRRPRPLGRTLFYFDWSSKLRARIFPVLLSRWYFYAMSFLTLLQTVVLSYETSSNYNTDTNHFGKIAWYDGVFVALYCVYTLNIVAHLIGFGAITSEQLSTAQLKAIAIQTAYYAVGSFLPVRSPAGRRRGEADLRGLKNLSHAFHDNASIIDDKVEGDAAHAAREAVIHSSRPVEEDELDAETKQPRPFFRKSWNRVEFISVLCFWLWLFLTRTPKRPEPFVIILSGLAHLRVLRLLDALEATRLVLSALKAALPLLRNVFVFIIVFWVAYSITGLQSFNASLSRNCVWVDPLGVEANYTTSQQCGSFLDVQTGRKLPYFSEDGDVGSRAKGFTCPRNSVCMTTGSPNDGTVSFDNIFNSMELVYVIMSQNTYSDIMYNIIDAEFLVSCLFFITGVLILNYWLISLLVAVLASSFSLVWRSLEKSKSMSPVPSNDEDHSKHIRRTRLGVFYYRVFRVFPVLILIDVIYQTSFDQPSQGYPFYWQVGLTSLLLIEILVRFYLYLPRWRMFLRSYINIADVLLAVLTFPPLFLSNDEQLYNWMTAFQLARFYRFVALFPVAEEMASTVLGNFRSVINLTLFYFGITFFAALISCKMFRGYIPYEDDGEVASVSFFDLSNAFIGMYQISSTENWTDVLYYAVQSGVDNIARACTGAILCLWLAFSSFILLNMFIAVMTENLSTAIVDKRRAQVRNFIRKYLNPESGAMQNPKAEGAYLALRRGLKLMMSNLRTKTKTKHVGGKFMEQIAEKEIIAEFLAHTEDTEEVDEEGKANRRGANLYSNKWLRFDWMARLSQRIRKLFERYPNQLKQRKMDRSIYDDDMNLVRSLKRRATETTNLSSTDRGEDETRPEDYVQFLYEHRAKTVADISNYSQEYPSFDKPLFLFSVDNQFRRFCQKLTPSSHGVRASGIEPKTWLIYTVSAVFLVATIGMVVSSCINTPYYHLELTKKDGRSQQSWTWITYLDAVFAGLFAFEFVVKVVADGFHYTPNAYTHSPWNVIDFVVLVSMIITLINDFLRGPVSRYSRALMALRAVRLMTIHPQAQTVFAAVFLRGFQNIMVAGFIGLCVVIPFSVWGLNLFKNRLNFCNDGDLDQLSDCVNEYLSSPSNWNVWAPRAIQKPYFDYDTFWSSLVIQFGVLSLEGWIDVLNAVMATTSKDTNPTPFATRVNGVFPVMYNFVGTVLVMTMFMSIIIRNYALSRDTAYLTPDQLTWMYMKKTLKLVKPKVPYPTYKPATVRYELLRQALAGYSVLNYIQTSALATGTINLMSAHYTEGDAALKANTIIFAVGAMVYFAVVALKLWALQWRAFKSDPWNVFALFTSLGTSVWTLIMLADINGSGNWAFDIQKAAIILHLGLWVPMFPSLKHLFRIATDNIQELLVILQTWFILFLTFAIAFNQAFGLTKVGPNGSGVMSFRDVPRSLILLFRMSTGEGWNQLMTDFLITEPYCVEGPFFESDCGSKWVTYLLFISWNIISMYIFCNLFISVIYETFWYIYRRTPTIITSRDLEMYQDRWQAFDINSTGFIKEEYLNQFIGSSMGYFSMGIYSNDPDYSVKAILERTNARQSYLNPYRVDYEAINSYLEDMPVEKFKRKRELYEIFCAHASYNAVPESGIGFNKLMKQYPLYLDMSPGKVMDLKSYLKLKVILHGIRMMLAVNFVTRRYRQRKLNEEASFSRRPSKFRGEIPQVLVDSL